MLNQDVGRYISRLRGRNFWAAVLFASYPWTFLFLWSCLYILQVFYLISPSYTATCDLVLSCTGRHICCKWPPLWCLLTFLKCKSFTQLKNKWTFDYSYPSRQTEISLLFLRGKSRPVVLNVFSWSNPFDQVRQ